MRINTSAFITLVFVSSGCVPYSISAYQQSNYENTCRDTGHPDEMLRAAVGIMGRKQQDSLDIFLAMQKYTYSEWDHEIVDTYMSRKGEKIVCRYRFERYKTMPEDPLKCKVYKGAISPQGITRIMRILNKSAFIDWPIHKVPKESEEQFYVGSHLSIGYQAVKGESFVVKRAEDPCISGQMHAIESIIDLY